MIGQKKKDPRLIFETVRHSFSGGLFGLPWKKNAPSSLDIFIIREEADSSMVLIREDAYEKKKDGVKALYFYKQTRDIKLSYAGLWDEDQRECDVEIKGQWIVHDSKTLLEKYSTIPYTLGIEVKEDTFLAWLTERLQPFIKDTVKESSMIDVIEKDSLPLPWWEENLNAFLEQYGITLSVSGVKVSGPSYEAKQAEKEQKDLYEKKQREIEMVQQRQLKQKEADAEYEIKKMEIEKNITISEKQRDEELNALEKQYRLQRLKLEKEIEKVKHESEQASLKHEIAMHKLQGEIRDYEKYKGQAAGQKRDYENLMEELEQAQTIMKNLPGRILASLNSGDERTMYQSMESLTWEDSLNPKILNRMGYDASRQEFIELVNTKYAKEGRTVLLDTKEGLKQRISGKEINTLVVNSPLQLNFKTKKSGYVTMLNIGTSGTVQVHVPNAYCSIEEAYARAGIVYTLPGDSLLPRDALLQNGLEYVEAGPVGWEHFVLFITESPLLSHKLFQSVHGTNPFPVLHGSAFTELHQIVQSFESWQCSAGLLSFIVKDPWK